MKAARGDRLIIDGNTSRAGEVIAVPRRDGSPPYVVRWMRSGHIALVSPDAYSSIIPAGGEQPDDRQQQPDGNRQ